VWINVPEISWHSWHPFEYFAVPAAAAAAAAGSTAAAGGCCGSSGSSKSSSQQQQQQTGMLLHIKAYDRWTRQLLDLVAAKGVNFTVKIEGPYAELPGAVLGHLEVHGGGCKNTGHGGFGGKSGGLAAHGSAGVDGLVIAAGESSCRK
jgi:hypothetical protein